MTAMSPAPGTTARDPIGLGLLLAGAALALLVAFALPALLGISAWEAVPWLTKLKIGFLAAAIAAAFLPSLARLRLPLILAAALMMLLPSVGAFIAGVYQWSDVRAEIVQFSGVRTPWIDPGWGILALFAAAMMALGAFWRTWRTTTTAATA